MKPSTQSGDGFIKPSLHISADTDNVCAMSLTGALPARPG
jgi:hypothetical protein